MASVEAVRDPPNAVPKDVVDNATDSGYGGSVADESASTSDNLFDKSFSQEVSRRHYLPSTRQQEAYKESCQLLTSSIEDTKDILKVPHSFLDIFVFGLILTLFRT